MAVQQEDHSGLFDYLDQNELNEFSIESCSILLPEAFKRFHGRQSNAV